MATFEESFPEIKTREQAISYLSDLVEQTRIARDACSPPVHLQADMAQEHLKNAYSNYRIRYGRAMGALTTLCHVRLLDHEAYMKFRTEVDETARPTVQVV